MAKVRYSRHARRDLIELWRHIAVRSELAADRVIDGIERRCRQLADFPESGPTRLEIGEGARSLTVERWLVLYRIVDDEVQIVRVVDAARDITKIRWLPSPE